MSYLGDQKFQHKKYSTPRHPWEAARIAQEKEILERYGLKNKRELWKSLSMLDSFRTQARTLEGKMRYQDEYSMQQFKNMIRRLQRFNILNEGATLDDVLSLKLDDILERRLQTLVFKMKLAITMKQARQLITHGQISLGGRRVTIPGLMVEASLEPTLAYDPDSPLADELHPIRQAILKKKEEPTEEKAEVPEPKPEVQKAAEPEEAKK
ncbi:Ribosomal protein S4/S9, eukaryotic/archaeal [mine drainage metagenome]|uniref:30S ribosomal protein S4 n=2 Tax=mine drainage metagenome TaxID=410659 RepID=T0ZM80_9ZZZZ